MGGSKEYTRFNLKFNRTDPRHIMAVEFINRQGQRSKAQYIANAVLHYENCGKSPDDGLQAQFNQKIIAIMTARALNGSVDMAAEKPAAVFTDPIQENNSVLAEDIIFKDAVKEFGKEGINAITGALDMFRQR